MQVDHDLQSRLPRPTERAVEVCDAARMSGPVAEDEIWYGNAHEIEPMVGDDAEILQGDVGVAVPAQFLGEIPLGPEGAVRAMHPDFVIFGSANERFRIHPFLQHQPVTEVHAVDSLVDAQHHASHRLSVRGFARLAVSAYSKTKQPKPNPYFSPMGQGTHRSQRSLAHCMRPAISHAAGWNRTTAGLGFRNDRGRPGGISRPASSRPPRSRRSRSRRFSHATRHR